MNLVVIILIMFVMRNVVHTSVNHETIPENGLIWMKPQSLTKEDMVDLKEHGMSDYLLDIITLYYCYDNGVS